jgi:serine protease inhibitor
MPSFDVEMTFDRPFLYGIVDLESTLPLFVGVLENPIE